MLRMMKIFLSLKGALCAWEQLVSATADFWSPPMHPLTASSVLRCWEREAARPPSQPLRWFAWLRFRR